MSKSRLSRKLILKEDKKTAVLYLVQSPRRLFFLIFGVTLGLGLFVQLIFLPHIAPHLHHGFGILAGDDSIKTDAHALARYGSLMEKGWSGWRANRPGRPMESIGAVVYYLTTPWPFVVLPFQALFFAAASVCLFLLLRAFALSGSVALLAALPFLLSPSSVLAYSGLLKDALDYLGVCLFLLSWVAFFSKSENKGEILRSLCGSLFASAIISYTRPHVVPTLMIFSIGALGVALLSRSFHQRKVMGIVVLGILLHLGTFLILPKHFNPARTEVPDDYHPQGNETYTWTPTSWLPQPIDHLFNIISRTRRGYLFEAATASTSLDVHTVWTKSTDVIGYFPRAVQLFLFAPFPDQWFSSSSAPTSRLFRLVGALHMMLFYLSLPFLVLFIIFWRRSKAMWFVFLFCLTQMMMQALVQVNMGTLFRQRFLYQQILVGFAILECVRRLRTR